MCLDKGKHFKTGSNFLNSAATARNQAIFSFWFKLPLLLHLKCRLSNMIGNFNTVGSQVLLEILDNRCKVLFIHLCLWANLMFEEAAYWLVVSVCQAWRKTAGTSTNSSFLWNDEVANSSFLSSRKWYEHKAHLQSNVSLLSLISSDVH